MTDNGRREMFEKKMHELTENAVAKVYAKRLAEKQEEKDVSGLADQQKFFAIEPADDEMVEVTYEEMAREVKRAFMEKRGAWLRQKIEELKKKLGDDID